ncbi:hypothetical protein GSH19_01370 [Lactobacillus sp. S2-2]|uniref:hypothetical protein n=1 Tax=Lactobacillus sp. S2-2 TaxID=2692917 RepID=UPI001F40E88E|nr:hypothetical protein [Lactobacillus sp. S2-2]MCF6514831.1 hypothetical protein [Lactobacillus sp. S2-2]
MEYSKEQYTDLLNQLKNQEIDSFEVYPSDFSNFQAAFSGFESKKKIIGKAYKEGKIIYSYNDKD